MKNIYISARSKEKEFSLIFSWHRYFCVWQSKARRAKITQNNACSQQEQQQEIKYIMKVRKKKMKIHWNECFMCQCIFQNHTSSVGEMRNNNKNSKNTVKIKRTRDTTNKWIKTSLSNLFTLVVLDIWYVFCDTFSFVVVFFVNFNSIHWGAFNDVVLGFYRCDFFQSVTSHSWKKLQNF